MKIKAEAEMNQKEKKKLAQMEAKRKRDELVGKMTKATEAGLGELADFMEIMNKYVRTGDSVAGLSG
jgi:hypothetical protein